VYRKPYPDGQQAAVQDTDLLANIDTAVVDSLKALDPERPIREADIAFC
jgi:hypothetical protein